MKKFNIFISGFIAVFTFFLFVSTPIKAQHMSGKDQSQHMGEHQQAAMHSTNQHMTNMNQHMMNMGDMMKHMNEMVEKSDHMLKSMHGEDGSTMMKGSENQNIMMMQHRVNDMTKDMQKMMDQMNKMIGDENLMNDPEMKKHMDEMHQNMNTMMNGMDGMIHTLEEVHNPDQQK